ncbi:tRNA 2-thiouridine(34) synthase MnmA [Glutamicibacter protophormiae]|uniref:tRNA-specific 2-thiouridylase MnmA n=1 Tax=Kocuria varians TaxID=1272 RepID=A0A7D7L0L1_KOCVA|nr:MULTISPECIES: tRNA 2-thiouridine(34) synthase MnmA [Kocuria]WNB89342.1 tRNA 2-thiouridine(34) synthase MnmA [Glutamicibacter protophormiae]MDN5630853.1 tRNA 2-thiouridine(34) synthase MnmA [Kocuria sp.]QMS57533.1 tRNA-specific 2-thiouridylase MnmA [Kocuria varians]RUP84509.1 tRNA 2-thiouridine(34) synthase MnmA [Kocuria sp. HSID17590]RUQ02618.1 tRNA 2-thiouridine(34) synthase MnmA [Kocuria sp. HSID17582]
MRVLAAMSGGVDSAVAAARAVDAGHDVTGVHLALSRTPGTLRTGARGCCTIEDSRDAWRAAEKLGIPYYVWDFSERFQADVVDDFVAEYAAGRTPNPCMRCNEKIKFAALLEKALALGFDAVCTGHYAKVVEDADGHKELHRAADWAKDQSYVLGVLTAEQLEHAIFPLAETPSKAQVRAEAEERGLSVAKKPDSHDICFIPDGNTRGWLEDHMDLDPGRIVDTEGNELGEHRGAQAYTVGQRRGLHIGRPAPDGKPRFVLEIRPKTNEVVVGPEQLLAIDVMEGIRPSWAGLPPREVAALGDATDARSEEFPVTVQVRAHGDPAPATAWLSREAGEPRLHVRLAESQRGVAPGQTMVLYQGTRVLGQATIDSAHADRPVVAAS